MKPTMVRPMSTAATIQARFEQAYLDRKASLSGKSGPTYVTKSTSNLSKIINCVK